MKLMKYFRDKYLTNKTDLSILDVGSRNVKVGAHDTYRSLFAPDYKYTGMDVEPGNNVDIVGYDALRGHLFDVVISGQVMEHVVRPWEWLKTLTLHFKKYICIIAPNKHREHRYPIDTYRYFPDGMRDLFDYAGIKELEIFKNNKDTVGIGERF